MKKIKEKIKNCVYEGTVDHVSSEYAFIVVEGLSKDVLVPHVYLRGAMHQDRVQVVVTTSSPKKEGRVITIIKRNTTTIVGRMNLETGTPTFLPDHKKIQYNIKVIPNPQVKWKDNDKVVLTIMHYPTMCDPVVGKITQVLGAIGSHQGETAALIAQFQLSSSFAANIENTVAQLPDHLSAEEIARRRDFRDITTVTIDPVDAKDFDDAVSIQKLPNGNYEVGIHIADVTHYVKEDTPLDEEAFRRGTSVYLVGNTISMLPERLANNLCSLRPREDRPAFSVVVTLDQAATIKDVWIGETVIHSNHRFTYEEAHTIIEEKKGIYHEELIILDQLAKEMRKKRIKAGAICFETTSPAIELDDKGNPTAIKPKSANSTHQLIEEYALLANRLVAQTVWKKKEKKKHLPFIYRTHDQPEAQRVDEFAQLVRHLGYRFSTNVKQLPQAYNQILTASKGTIHETMIQILSIRTMAQACYTTSPRGHFGLGFQYYTHFTSPIRRYPDVIVHRLLKYYLAGKKANQLPSRDYEAIARHTSVRERVATEAERASITVKQVVFMKKLEGEVHEGVISSVKEWGIYVELKKHKCEGLVRFSSMSDDYYFFDPRHFYIKGKEKGKIYRMGDLVKVRIKEASIPKKTVDFEFVNEESQVKKLPK